MEDCDEPRQSITSVRTPIDAGDYRSASSTHSKLYGITAPVLLLTSLKRYCGTAQQAKKSRLCDSELALKQV
jgi:hypothetical protein